jgi:hypothetical protein
VTDSADDRTQRERTPEGDAAPDLPWIGVVIVTYGAEDFIDACLESVLASGYPRLAVTVVDNKSPDATTAAIRGWAAGVRPFRPDETWPLERREPVAKPLRLDERDAWRGRTSIDRDADVTLLHSGENRGFAGGVNVGLEALRADPDIAHFWVLNPDTVVEPQTPFALARKARKMGRFAMIGGRVVYLEAPDTVHTDAGRHRPWMGFPASVNIGRKTEEAKRPDAEEIDYIPGVSMFVSRDFLDRAGLMDESWFLYHEEIDWCFRRGDLPLGLAEDARVLHRAGASIGSGSGRRVASPLSVYFTYRNHLRFARRWAPRWLPTAYVAGWAMALRRYKRDWPQLVAAIRGLHRMAPPRAVRRKLPEGTWLRIFERQRDC